MENPTRRRLLAAGFAGTTLGLLGSRAVSASPDTTTPPTDEGSTPASTTTAPPLNPTPEDIPRLQFAQAFELAARELYQAAIDAGADDETLLALRDNHQSYADVLRGRLGTESVQTPDERVLREFESGFATSDVTEVARIAYELESVAVATHAEAIGELQGIDGAHLIASIAVIEARHATVLADMAGRGDDFDALFENEAQPMSAGTSIGG